MPSTLPSDDPARARLREAQKAESAALAAVQAAEKVRTRAASALQSAEIALDRARAELVRGSGMERAALLLDVPVRDLRRLRGGRATEASVSQ